MDPNLSLLHLLVYETVLVCSTLPPSGTSTESVKLSSLCLSVDEVLGSESNSWSTDYEKAYGTVSFQRSSG